MNGRVVLPGLRRATPRERSDVIAIGGLTALFGLGLLLTSVGGYSLFVEEFGAGALPFVYAAAAVLSIVLGSADVWLARRTSLAVRAGLIGSLIAVVTLALGMTALTMPSRLVAFLLPVAFEIAYVLGQSMLLAIAASRFDLRQSKRLMSTALAGRWVSYAFLGPVVALWATGVRPSVLVIGGGVSLLAMGGRAVAMARSVPHAVGGLLAETGEDSESIRPNPLARSIMGLGSAAVALVFLAEFMVYERADAVLAPGDLPVAFAIIGSIQGIIILVASLLLSTWSWRRLGVGGALVVLPLVLVVPVVAFIASLILGDGILTLALAVAIYVMEAALRESLAKPARLTLYQVLPPALAARTLSLTEGPLVAVLAGVVSVVIAALVLLSTPPEVAGGIVLLLLMAWMRIGVVARRRYLAALDVAIVRRELGEGVVVSRELSTMLRQRLQDPDPGRAVAAARMILELGLDDGVMPAELLTHREPAVRTMALVALVADDLTTDGLVLRTIVNGGERQATTKAARGADAGSVPLLDRAMALRAAARQGEDWVGDVVGDLLDHGDLIGFAGLEVRSDQPVHDAHAQRARRLLAEAVGSNDDGRRRQAAQMVGLVGRAEQARPLLSLMGDRNHDVRALALEAVPVVDTPEVWQVAARMAGDARLLGTVSRILANGGTRSAVALAAVLGDPTAPVYLRCRVVRIAARHSDPLVNQAMIDLLQDSDPRVRQATLQALSQAEFTAEHGQVATIRQILASLVDRIEQLLAAAGSTVDLLYDAVVSALERERTMLLHGLSLLGHHAEVRAALAAVDAASTAHAIEFLDTAVSSRDRPLVDALDRPVPPPADPGRRHMPVPALDGWLTLLQQPQTPQSEDRGGADMLPMVERVVTLKASAMFANTPPTVILDIARGMDEHRLADGEVLFRIGDFGDRLYIVVDGAIAILFDDREIDCLRTGEAFGELALLDPEPRSAGATSVGDTLLLSLDHQTFYDLLTDRPEVTMAMFRYVAARMRDLSKRGAAASGSGPRIRD